MIGAIADDVTGGTDVAVALRRGGLRTLLFFGVPPAGTTLPAHDAVVVALKSRMASPQQAVAMSLEALEWLRNNKVSQVYVKYCSTFDSTAEGNIGPVLDALSSALSVDVVVTTPSSPRHGRTQYRGHLFIGDGLLAESPMREHPVTPMRDSNLVRLLQAQTRTPVGLIGHDTVREGATAVRGVLERPAARYLLADATTDEDLLVLGRVLAGAPLVAGAAGLASGLAAAAGSSQASGPDVLPAGRSAALSGSCSARTLDQVAEVLRRGRPAHRLDPVAVPDPAALAARALAWFDAADADGALIYSSMPPEDLHRTQEVLGVQRSARVLERATGLIAAGLVRRGVRRLVAAGGETSGAVVAALGVRGGVVGAEAAPGVPWIHPVDPAHPALLLKSGNFGEPDLLAVATEPAR
ncbi:HPr kinase [Lentzea pudingi]|uniref:3-oxo-tetronate kinase n=1 Tax=Lentzea pudingi TaxID=1789439 RepID=A0ABQ2HSJ2_9PSEU|nr:3-oxo-tetronate kinase [Lentzea pudingi]GGM90401.1 HPr kinase [Lentzea pudingi]